MASHGRSIKSIYSKFSLIVSNLKNEKCDISKFALSECNCGWSVYYSNLNGIRFPCIHEMLHPSFSKCPSPPNLNIASYNNFNEVRRMTSNIVECFPRNNNNKNSNSYRMLSTRKFDIEEYHHIIIKSKGVKARNALSEFWKVNREIRVMFGLDCMTALDLSIVTFYDWHLLDEENATSENIAHFRLQCWKEAEQISSKINNI